MQISDSAKVILENMLEEEGKNCLTFFVQGHGCHSQLCMDFIVVSEANQINGLNVEMNEETSRMLEDIILDANDGNLVIRSTAPATGCGGCSGCASDEGCGGCDGGCC